MCVIMFCTMFTVRCCFHLPTQEDDNDGDKFSNDEDDDFGSGGGGFALVVNAHRI